MASHSAQSLEQSRLHLVPGACVGGRRPREVIISLRNRLIVMTQWLWFYASFEPGARLITGLRTIKADHEPAHARRRDDNALPPDGQRAAGTICDELGPGVPKTTRTQQDATSRNLGGLT